MLATAPQPVEERYLSYREVADRLGCHTETVRALVAKGELERKVFGPRMHRVPESSLFAYIARTGR